MRRWFALSLLALLLSACAGRPSRTLDLAPLLLQPGDLPEGMVGDTQDWSPGDDDAATAPLLEVGQRLKPRGGVSIRMYDRAATATVVFDQLTPGRYQAAVDAFAAVGERRAAGGESWLEPEGMQFERRLLFIRCGALVTIAMSQSGVSPGQPPAALDHAVAHYAGRLDQRLSSALCFEH